MLGPATLTALSTSAGNATFSLEVTFVPGDVSVQPAGDCTTALTGTVIAN